MLRTSIFVWLLAGSPTPQARTNPFPHTPQSIETGRRIYFKRCTRCHDAKGKPVLPTDPGATHPADLTRPKEWEHGMTDGEMFDTLREGTEEMAGFKDKLSDDEIWRVIHFVRSLWPEELRRRSYEDN